MKNQNLANTYRPSTFAEYSKGNPKNKSAALFFQNLISKNYHSKNNSLGFATNRILLYGNSGSGKTSLIQLYSKAIFCENRKPGEFELCGKCPVCLGQDTSNIHHYVAKDPKEAREVIPKLMECAYNYPISSTTTGDKFRKVIIIDEAENLSPELYKTLLDPLEFAPEFTTIIISTMNVEKLEKLDSITKDAIESRCVSIHLNSFTEEDISSILDSQIENKEVANTIAKFSNGNMRRAWQILSREKVKGGGLSIDELYREHAGGATLESREKMWSALFSGNSKEVVELCNSWGSSKTVGLLLLEDITKLIYKEGSKESCEMLASIGRWLSTSHSFPVYASLLPFLNLSVKEEEEEEEEVNPVIKSRVQEQLEKIKRNKSLDIVSQLLRIKRLEDLDASSFPFTRS